MKYTSGARKRNPRIRSRPATIHAMLVAISDRIKLGPIDAYSLSLAFDHRVLNGMEAAESLTAIAARMETLL